MWKQMMALALALALCAAMPALAEVMELSDCYGESISEAAQRIGGLTYESGEEYAENYESDALALRGNGGKVELVELKAEPGEYSLCGVSVGMNRKAVLDLMADNPKLWEYEEEVAYIIQEDKDNLLNSLTLVVFFDEDFLVNGVWYRTSEE